MENLIDQKGTFRKLLHEKNVVNAYFVCNLSVKKRRSILNNLRKYPKITNQTLMRYLNWMTIGEFSLLYFLSMESKKKFNEYTTEEIKTNKLGIVGHLLSVDHLITTPNTQ
jgi:hypothetical protein